MVSKSQSLAGRYASALYELADQERCLDSVASDLSNFSKLIDESEALDRLIRSPVISREDQLSSNPTTVEFRACLARHSAADRRVAGDEGTRRTSVAC